MLLEHLLCFGRWQCSLSHSINELQY
jgi:hypothetical protein